MSRPRFLKIFLQINIFSVFSILPLTVHAQGTETVLQERARQPTARVLPSTAPGISHPASAAQHKHPPAPSADHLGAIFDTESISSLLNRNNDALRRSDDSRLLCARRSLRPSCASFRLTGTGCRNAASALSSPTREKRWRMLAAALARACPTPMN